MDSNEICWRIVSNTVSKRMIDLSFVHKLIPSRKLYHRTKVMNAAIKHRHGLKTYEQYVKMKTFVLRNLSDHSDTDNNNSFSDNEYGCLDKSTDLPITDCTTDVTTTNTDCFRKAELDVNDCNMSSVINETTNARQSKNTCSNTVNLGWQKIVKNSNVKPACSPKKNNRESKSNKPDETNHYKSSATNSNKVVLKNDTISFVEGTHNIKMCTDNAYKNMNRLNSSTILKSKKELNGVKRDLISFLDQETTVQPVDIHSAYTESNFKDSYSMLNTRCVKVQEEPADKSNSQPLQMYSLFSDNANQPKDSGIEEDTEEEFHENGKAVYVKRKKKTQELCKNVNLMLPVAECKNVSTTKNTSTNADNLSDICDTSDNTTDSHCTALFTHKDTNSEETEQNKLQKVKLQPKVTCTKVIKNKYRIISDNSSLSEKCLEAKFSDDHIGSNAMDSVNVKCNADDTMSSSSKRRLQQLRRLNLTEDSESSFSEDDSEHNNAVNMRDKLFNRSKESFDLSDSKNENIDFTLASSLNDRKKLKTNKKYTNNNEFVRSLKSAKSNGNDHEDTLHSSCKTETYSLTNQCKTNAQTARCSGNKNDSSEENRIHERLFEENHETERISNAGEIALPRCTTIKNSTIRSRPHNLLELMDQESLVFETTLPSVTLKDLRENNIFLLDIPSVILETKLVGRKFILTENKLKLGKHKYKIAFNDIDHMSCVFSTGDTGESCTDYKAVNMKSMKRFVAYKKMVKTTSEK